MSVEIEPAELGFHRPFTSEVSQTLKIHNSNHTPVAFKVKTTAPKQYCVRPNSGRIEPGQHVEVSVLLQAMKQDPPIDARCRDKFLVQSVAIDSSKEFANPGSIWQHIDESEKSTIQEKKIRVVFLGPSSSAAASTPSRNGLNGGSNRNSSVATPEVAPPAYDNARSPSPEDTFTPATRNSVRTASVGPSIKSEPEVKEESSTVKESVVSAASAAVGAVAGVMKPTIEQLKAQLTEVEAKIAAYNREHGVTEGLRQRSSAIAKGETSSPVVNDMAVRVQRSEGVPVQIVAALCLLSFLLAYLFF